MFIKIVPYVLLLGGLIGLLFGMVPIEGGIEQASHPLAKLFIQLTHVPFYYQLLAIAVGGFWIREQLKSNPTNE